MRKAVSFCVAVASLVAFATPGHVSAATRVVFHDHANFTDTFPNSRCGIDGTDVVKGVDNFTIYSNNMFKDNFTITETFTSAATGKSVVIHVAQQVTGNNDPIVNADGTVSFINTFKGLPELIKIKNGPTLSRDAGTVTFTDTFAVDPLTGDLTFLGETLSGLHGPHPDLLSDFAIFCNVIIPALS